MNLKHNLTKTSTYGVWRAMRYRCNNSKSKYYSHYGGRGIKVCKRWDVYLNFLNDMGEKPQGLSLDRKNNDGNYEPSNCRWATQLQQNENSSRVKLVTYKGKTQNLKRWAEELGLTYVTVAARMSKHNMSFEEAIARPIRAHLVGNKHNSISVADRK